jgi:hypothetical protein
VGQAAQAHHIQPCRNEIHIRLPTPSDDRTDEERIDLRKGVAPFTERLLSQVSAMMRRLAMEDGTLASLWPILPIGRSRPSSGWSRGQDVRRGYHLRNGSLQVDVDSAGFGQAGQVRATARYRLSRQDIPLLFVGKVTLERTHVEPVAPYRSLGGPGADGGPGR